MLYTKCAPHHSSRTHTVWRWYPNSNLAQNDDGLFNGTVWQVAGRNLSVRMKTACEKVVYPADAVAVNEG